MKQNNINKATDLGVNIVLAIAVDWIDHFTIVNLVLILERFGSMSKAVT